MSAREAELARRHSGWTFELNAFGLLAHANYERAGGNTPPTWTEADVDLLRGVVENLAPELGVTSAVVRGNPPDVEGASNVRLSKQVDGTRLRLTIVGHEGTGFRPPRELLTDEELLAPWAGTPVLVLQPCPPGYTGGSCNSLTSFSPDHVHVSHAIVIVEHDDALQVRFAATINQSAPMCVPALLDRITGEAIVDKPLDFIVVRDEPERVDTERSAPRDVEPAMDCEGTPHQRAVCECLRTRDAGECRQP